MDIDLTGKKAMVCGASKGIGRAVALELAGLGATVTIVARDSKNLAALCKDLASNRGQKHQCLSIDFSQTQSLKTVMQKYAEDCGPFHILINNTGGPPAGTICVAGDEAFIAPFSQHLIASHIIMQALREGMKQEKYGRIINIISTSVKQPIKGLGVSNTIRGAMANWAKTLAGEIAEFGITVNNVLPGYTETDRLDEILKAKAAQAKKTLEEIVEHERATVPAKRFGTPQEIAQAVAFLASPAAAYINGINLPVDGGRTACL